MNTSEPKAQDWHSRLNRWSQSMFDWFDRHEEPIIILSVMICIVCVLGLLGILVLVLTHP